jgi:NADPH:quinone reductase-like Zn-dependent oxidoreductase
MKAAQITQYGHADAIKLKSASKPKAGPGQVLIEVHASSINPADSKVREGMGKVPLPMTLGLDVAGLVDSVGPEVTHLKAGDRVYGQAGTSAGGSGAFAEFAVAAAEQLAKMPDRLNYVEAAAVSLTGTSALQAITEHLALKPSQKILIHGGAGGIGSIAIQIARHLGGYVATTVSTEDVEFARGLGANLVIDYKKEAFEPLVSDFDAVFDTVGGETCARSYKVLKPGGILVSMTEAPNEALAQQLEITAILQLTRATTERLAALAKLIDAGVVTIHVDKTYRLDQVTEAFNEKENGHVRGKIAIEVRKH